MRISNQIVLASNNKHKLAEFRKLLEPYSDIELLPAKSFLRNTDKLGLVETFDTYAENAGAKARLCNLGSHYPSLADDSGIEVQALEGKPGVRSHRFAIPKAGETQSGANIAKLLSEIQGVPPEKRVARFVCHLALVVEGIMVSAEGILNGHITDSPRGNTGFGYDPVFVPDGSTKTLAEISEAEKNEISHRHNALENLMQVISDKGIVFAKP